MEPTRSQRILVVDDEPSIVDAVATSLRYEGFDVAEAVNGRLALASAQDNPPDLIVLDVMLPDLDGIEVTRRLRADGLRVPVLFLTARDAVEDKVVGLTVGGDDYVTKPYRLRELVARIRSVLRRVQNGQGGRGPMPEARPGELLQFDGWTLDPLKRRLLDSEGAVVAISSVEFRLLIAFLDHPRQVLDRDRLLDMVQGREAHLFDRAVDNQISRLRRKIEPDSRNPQLIQTVWGGGYMLAAEVRKFAARD